MVFRFLITTFVRKLEVFKKPHATHTILLPHPLDGYLAASKKPPFDYY